MSQKRTLVEIPLTQSIFTSPKLNPNILAYFFESRYSCIIQELIKQGQICIRGCTGEVCLRKKFLRFKHPTRGIFFIFPCKINFFLRTFKLIVLHLKKFHLRLFSYNTAILKVFKRLIECLSPA